eukprot:260302_1
MQETDTTHKRPSETSVEELEKCSEENAESCETEQMARRKKKKARKRVQKGSATKQDYQALFGPDARPSITLKLEQAYKKNNAKHLKIADVQGLLLWVLGEGINPRWVFVEKKVLIQKVVMIMVDSLSFDLVTKNSLHFKKLAEIFPQACPVLIPSSLFSKTSVIQYFMNFTSKIPGFKIQKKKKTPKVAHSGGKNLPRARYYILSAVELKENNFPADDILSADPEYIRLGQRPHTVEEGEVVVGDASENGASVPESDVGPSGLKVGPLELNIGPSGLDVSVSVTDESTPKSDADLSGSDLDDVKMEMNGCADSDSPPHMVAIDCEMVTTENGLELARCTLVDENGATIYDKLCKPTATITNYNTLYSGITQDMLAPVETRLKDVQNDLKKLLFRDTILVGHSLENDLMAMKIYHQRVIDTSVLYPHRAGPPVKSSLKYLARTHLKKDIQTGGAKGHDSVEDAVTALELVKLKIANGPGFGVSTFSCENAFGVMNRFRKRSSLVARTDILKRFARSACSAVAISSDAEAVRKSKSILEGSDDFVWFSLKGPGMGSEISASDMESMDSNVAEIYENCPENSLVIVSTGQGTSYKAKCMQEEKMGYIKNDERDKWTDDMQTELDKVMASTQNGLCFFAIK